MQDPGTETKFSSEAQVGKGRRLEGKESNEGVKVIEGGKRKVY